MNVGEKYQVKKESYTHGYDEGDIITTIQVGTVKDDTDTTSDEVMYLMERDSDGYEQWMLESQVEKVED